MSAKFTPSERLKIVKRAIAGESVVALSKELGISRTLIYRWVNRYKNKQTKDHLSPLKPKTRGVSSLDTKNDPKVKQIIEVIKTNPEWGVAKIAYYLQKEANLNISAHGVQIILEKLNLSTTSKRLEYQTPKISTSALQQKSSELLNIEAQDGKSLNPQQRLEMIERVKLGESVERVCQLYGISRPVFYKWLKRYQQASEGQKLEALWDQKPKVEYYYNQAPEEYEEAVLSAVKEYPELSSHRLVWTLPQVGGRPILGNHGVQNVLKRHNLSTYEQRFLFAQAASKPTVSTHFFRSLLAVLGKVATLPTSKRSFTVKASLSIGLALFTGVVFYGGYSLIAMILSAPSIAVSLGIIVSLISLACGMLFFIYSLKYYFTITAILSFSRNSSLDTSADQTKSGRNIQGYLSQIYKNNKGLNPDLSNVVLDRSPFISIHLATYNEKKVVDRLLTAATAMEYENYEVIIADDSNDETLEILKKWENHPRVKIVHRPNRTGFKGGALSYALSNTNPKAEFIVIFDADFIPYPDTLTSFLKYFKHSTGSLDPRKYPHTNIGAVQGYQWHVLNKSENWITRGVRGEYSGSYVMERSGEELYGGLKQISGSVYMIRKDVLTSIGWGVSITEDFELTLKLYERGYKVVYTPYIQAPAEAVSTIKRLIRQRMRWAEGHSHNIKKMFTRLMFSPNLTKIEKLELLYLSPYYLQSFFFIIGTFCWFLAEVVFQTGLPFWTATWGWSLVFTNLLALPLMNMVGLFLEESSEKDYLGIFSFVALSYIVAPFQGYAAVKGFLEKQEGPWFRTPKTGKITDVFTPGRFYRYVWKIFGKPASPKVPSNLQPNISINNKIEYNQLTKLDNSYLELNSSLNQFNSFSIKKTKKLWWVAKISLALLLIFTTSMLFFSRSIKLIYATNWNGPLKLDIGAGEGTFPAFGNYLNDTTTYAASGGNIFPFNRGAAHSVSKNNYSWFTNLWPTGTQNATIPAGNYYVQVGKSGNSAANSGNGVINIGYVLQLTNNDGTSNTQIDIRINQWAWNNADNTQVQFMVANLVGNNIVSTARNRLQFRIMYVNAGTTNNGITINLLLNNAGAGGAAMSRLIIPANITVPEIPKKAIFLAAIIILPLAPALIHARLRRKEKNMVEELKDDLRDLIARLLGEERELDELPV